MGTIQLFIVVVWGYDPDKKRVVVKIPQVFSSKADAVNFVRLNKIPNDNSTKWEVHTSTVELTENFNFARDIRPNIG